MCHIGEKSEIEIWLPRGSMAETTCSLNPVLLPYQTQLHHFQTSLWLGMVLLLSSIHQNWVKECILFPDPVSPWTTPTGDWLIGVNMVPKASLGVKLMTLQSQNRAQDPELLLGEEVPNQDYFHWTLTQVRETSIVLNH